MAASADDPAGPPELFLARQPLLDPRGRTVGFELLHRSTRHGPSGLQPSAATAQVLLAALADIGLERVVGSVPPGSTSRASSSSTSARSRWRRSTS